MCTALRIPTGRYQQDWRDIDFDVGASIPAARHDRSLKWFPWGRPRGDAGARLWPSGGWVSLEVIRSGKWWRLNPRPVVVPCEAFRIRSRAAGFAGDHWCRPDEMQAIQGALCTREGEQRIYVVTQYHPDYEIHIWPRLVPYPAALVKWRDGPEEMFPDEMD